MIFVYFSGAMAFLCIPALIARAILEFKSLKAGNEIVSYIKEHLPEDWVRLGRPLKPLVPAQVGLHIFRVVRFEDVESRRKAIGESNFEFGRRIKKEKELLSSQFWNFTKEASKKDRILRDLVEKDEKNTKAFNLVLPVSIFASFLISVVLYFLVRIF